MSVTLPLMLLNKDGSLWACGMDIFTEDTLRSYAQTGEYINPIYKTTPLKIMDGVVDVSAGIHHALVIKSDGSLWGFGTNETGRLGLGHTSGAIGAWYAANDPQKIMDDVVSVSVDSRGLVSAAIKTDGSLWVWGSNHNGGLGIGSPTPERQVTPIKILDDVASVRIFGYIAFAVKTDSTLWVWGTNFRGLATCNASLRENTDSVIIAPIKTMDGVTDVGNSSHTYAVLKLDGSFWVWGAGLEAFGLTDYNIREKWAIYNPVKIMDEIKLPASAQATTPQSALEIKVLVNDSTLTFDVPPVIENGRTLVPLRAIFEALGATIDWQQSTQTVTAVKDDTTIVLTIGAENFIKNGGVISLDVPGKLLSGRTLVPVRAISEAFDLKVDWEQSTRTVTITTE